MEADYSRKAVEYMKGSKSTKIKQGKSGVIFDICNYAILALLGIITVYPLYYVVIASISDNTRLQFFKGILLLPQGIDFGAYKLAFQHPKIVRGFLNTLKILALSLPVNIVMTLLCANFLAAKNVMFKRSLTLFMMFTMYFSGGLIPTYLNMRDLNLIGSVWSLVLGNALSLYNAIITKTAIEAIPDSLSESAYIDGAGELTVLFRIILPLIKPTIAVLLLYYGVGIWNSWFQASIYLSDAQLPIQNILRAILLENADYGSAENSGDVVANSYTESIKYAAIVISTVPILVVYPFLQKYFAKGVMVGAVKG